MLKKLLSFGYGSIFTMILGFISSPLITRIIEPEEFGKFSMFNSITSLASILIACGIDQAYIRFYYIEKEENRDLLLKKSLIVPIFINILLSIILLLCYKPLSFIIIGRQSIRIILLVILQNTLNVFSKFLLINIRMQQKGNLYSLLQIIGKIVYLVSIIFLISIVGKNYKCLVYAIIISNIIILMLMIINNKNLYFRKSSNSRQSVQTSYSEMFKYGYPLVLALSISWIFQSSDKILISKLVGYNELGIYSGAYSIVSLLTILQGTFVTVWTAIANQKYEENKENILFFNKVYCNVAIIMFLLGILMVMFKNVIIYFLGSSYSKGSYVFPFLVLMPVLITISETTVIGINFTKNTKYHIFISIYSAIFNIVGNLFMIPILGAKGAAISTGTSYVLYFILRTIIGQKYYNININYKSLIPSIICIILYASYATFFDSYLYIIGFILLFIIILLYKSNINAYLNCLNHIIKKEG
ncbi:oligosaccharide flippase family protein [Turicibacter bilis]|uniref:Oligosaccharide flippase family protein n=1 Tax=Turicibacter bilis TaxID=2735723 RepID=A0A9Q9CRA6_9FIRM|nr:oligosaccharide flippase family protein [Turicibacter bilis]MBS3198663.1 oligosaccharide flippase family protein [Turicibacter bilis]UUF08318.1 oligosaccharide flippase family protein [Turicibacter bilis]